MIHIFLKSSALVSSASKFADLCGFLTAYTLTPGNSLLLESNITHAEPEHFDIINAVICSHKSKEPFPKLPEVI